MNHSESRLWTNPRIVPQDLLLKFGYSPDNGIKFDSVAETLSFYQGGTQRVDISSFGLVVRNGEGLVIGHTAQVNAGLGALEFEVLGTGDADSSMLLGRWGNDDQAPTLSFTKSRDPAIADGTFAVVNDGDEIGRLYFTADDGTDLLTPAAQIHVEVDGTPGANDMPGRIIFSTTPDGAATVSEALRIDSSQNVSMRNESYLWIGPDGAATGYVDSKTTVGLIINQEANDNAVITVKSSDVAHGITDVVETDTYWSINKQSATSGGALIRALTENKTALEISTVHTVDDTTKTTAATASIVLAVYKKSGTGAGAVGADGNLVVIARSGTARFIFDVEGSAHADVEWTTYDKYDDLALISDIETQLLRREDEGQTGRRQYLELSGIIGQDSWHFEDGKQRAMVDFTRLAMLHHGALIQVGERLGVSDQNHMSLVERVDSLAVELIEAKQQLAALTEL